MQFAGVQEVSKLEDIMRPIDEAPRDGSMIIARFQDWNQSRNPLDGGKTDISWQPVWWMPDSKGKNPRWKRYGTLDTSAFASHFVTPAEFAAHGEDDQPQPRRAAVNEEYDL